MLECIPHLHCNFIPQVVSLCIAFLVVIITAWKINIVVRVYVIGLVVKPSLISIVHFYDIVKDEGSCWNFDLVPY